MKKILLGVITILMLSPLNVFAKNTIYNMDIKIDIQKNATAKITETWDVEGEDGTEWYKVINNLGNSYIDNYIVYMDGEELTRDELWDINKSLEEKAGYYGTNYTDEGVELCFGKSDYNRHSFTLQYDISNFVFNTDDSQVVYWKLVDKLSSVDFQKYRVTVTSYYPFSKKLDVWGFGYNGYAYVKDGKIVLSNKENTNMNNKYGVLLAKFPKNTFDTSNSDYKYGKFNDVLKAAKKGSYKNNYIDFDEIISIFRPIISVFLFILAIALFIKISKKIEKIPRNYIYENKKKAKYKKSPMFREIPCNKDIYYANAIMYMNNFPKYKEINIFGAILLKWIKEDKIKILNESKVTIELNKNVKFKDKTEERLFNAMNKASEDGVLEPKELKKWSKKNNDRILNIFKDIKDIELSKLKSDKLVNKKNNKIIMSDEIYDNAMKLYGLKKYLLEFSNIKEKESIDVKLLDEYLMFAYLFGIAKKVIKQLKEQYPEIIDEKELNLFDSSDIIDSFTYHTTYTPKTERLFYGLGSSTTGSSDFESASSYSSGGGGFSSGGGGGGSFGGGGGGSR